MLCCAVLYSTVLYCTVLYCTVLYCTVLYCTVLYCTNLDLKDMICDSMDSIKVYNLVALEFDKLNDIYLCITPWCNTGTLNGVCNHVFC